ncbi:putative 2OG-Fe(II) oxygenase [Zavarzinia sp.]|uniref:putative 2OG-Fe(II) oxygenase n=1 Tax=Zavarzinia sp. TaxID=2027920 RepID=UPI00356A7BA6
MSPLAPGFHALWPTPIGIYRLAGAEAFNARLVAAFDALRAEQRRQRGEAARPFFASDDDLVQRVTLPGWADFVRFVVDRVHDTAARANEGHWPDGGLDLRVALQGMWFQCSNAGAFHDVHTHGNCSWSGVYVVQVDPEEARVRHPVHGAANGATRFYGPPFATLGGAFVDVGNAYLQPPHRDVAPVAGQLTIFPSWLAHQALPYAGTAERVIVSFNASVHAAGGDRLHAYAAG